ncbi:hypothetical protein [Nocardia colli]
MATVLDLVLRGFARTSISWLVLLPLVNGSGRPKQIQAKAWLSAELAF